MSKKIEFNEKLAKLLKIGVFIVAFVPLIIFSDFISPFHFGKVVVFRSIVELMIPLYLILIIRDRSYLPKLNSILVSLFVFTGLFLVSSLFSTNSYLSFWGSLERMGGFWTFLHYVIFYVILVSVLRKREDWVFLLKLLVAVGVLSAIYGFGQKTDIKFFVGSGGRARIFGTLGNAALFAGFEIFIFFLSLIFLFSDLAPQKQKKYFVVAAFISALSILMTVVRGSILGLGTGIVLFSILYFLNFKTKIAKKILLTVGVLLLFFIVFSFVLKDSNLVKNSGFLSRVTDFSLDSFTVQTRFWAWRAGINGWVESAKTVLIGWGPENFNVPFSKYFNPRFFRGIGSETLFDRAHNMFVEVLVTMGLLSLLAYISLFASAYWKSWKASLTLDKTVSIGLISLLTAYIIHNSFIFDTSPNYIAFFIILGFINFLSSPKTDKTQVPGVSQPRSSYADKPKGILKTAFIIMLLASFYAVYKINILPIRANYTVTRGIVASWAGDMEGAVSKFKKALAYDVPGKYDYRHRFAQLAIDKLSSGETDDRKKAIIEYAIEEVKKNEAEVNQDYLPYLYISRLYIILGKNDPKSPYNDIALENSLKALAISNNFVRTYYEVAQAHLNKDDFDQAIEVFNQAVELNPDVGLSYWYLAIAELEAGQYEQGFNTVEAAKKKGYSLSENDMLRLVNFYVKINDFAKTAELYEDLILLKPGNPQYFASLAVSYANTGQIDKAVEAAYAAARLDRSFEPDARAFIESLGRIYPPK